MPDVGSSCGLVESCVRQDVREVKTKYSKTFVTYFFPVGKEVQQIVADWVRFQREEKLWCQDDSLLPATRIALRQAQRFEASGPFRARLHLWFGTKVKKIGGGGR